MLNFLSLTAVAFLSITTAHANSCRSLNNDPLYAELYNELKAQNINCSGIKSHLTFDDGPNEKTSAAILQELDKRNIKATFYVTTTNLNANKPGLAERQAILKRQIQNGHTVASHGHEHNAYDLRIAGTTEAGYTANEREKQIKESVRLLNVATDGKFSKQPLQLFRFPYGRGAMPSKAEIERLEDSGKMSFKGVSYADKLKEYRKRSPALLQIAAHNFSHVGWNHDSNDSSLPFTMPAPDVFKNYVKENMLEMCTQKKKTKVSLYHDIKEVNTRAIPLIADLGTCLGVKFITPQESMNDSFLTSTDVIIKNKTVAKAPVEAVDEIGDLIKSINGPPRQCPDAIAKVAAATEGCYSTYQKKTFLNCEGQTSKCWEGKWYGMNDPLILLNCY